MQSLVVLAVLLIGLSGSWIADGQTSGSSESMSESAAQQSTRLLVLFPAGVARPSNAVLLKSLKKLPRNGWLVSVERADGNLTGFVSRDALAGTLTENTTVQNSPAQLDATIQELLRDPQNSAVLFASKVQPLFQRPEWTHALVRKRVPIYVVDGGWWSTKQIDMSSGSDPGWFMGSDTRTTRTRTYTIGILHEVNLAGAVEDIVKDRKSGYTFLYAQPNKR